MAKKSIDWMFTSPSMGIRMLGMIGQTLLEYKDCTFVCTICNNVDGIAYEPAAYVAALGSQSEKSTYQLLALCKKHAIYTPEK